MILVKCDKCKWVAVEVSEEKAKEEGYFESAQECSMCGNSYNNFSETSGKEVPDGSTMTVILRRGNV